jgi:DNA-binding CsgD family transcriptional regulator
LFYIEHADFSQTGAIDRWHVLKMKPYPPKNHVLSNRQRECLRLIAEGHTARSISVQLGISIRMVRFHLRASREKLNALSTSQAIHIAAKQHLLE